MLKTHGNTYEVLEIVVLDVFVFLILRLELKDWLMIVQILAALAAFIYTCIRIGQWGFETIRRKKNKKP